MCVCRDWGRWAWRGTTVTRGDGGFADVASGVRPTEIGNYLFIDCSYAPCVNANVWKHYKLFVFIHREQWMKCMHIYNTCTIRIRIRMNMNMKLFKNINCWKRLSYLTPVDNVFLSLDFQRFAIRAATSTSFAHFAILTSAAVSPHATFLYNFPQRKEQVAKNDIGIDCIYLYCIYYASRRVASALANAFIVYAIIIWYICVHRRVLSVYRSVIADSHFIDSNYEISPRLQQACGPLIRMAPLGVWLPFNYDFWINKKLRFVFVLVCVSGIYGRARTLQAEVWLVYLYWRHKMFANCKYFVIYDYCQQLAEAIEIISFGYFEKPQNN